MGVARVTAVVPTIGASPWLERCLDALRADGGEGIRIVVVAQGGGRDPSPLAAKADLWLDLPDNRGFSAGTNAGIEAAVEAAGETPYVATVNDDAVVRPGWTTALLAALEADPGAAAAQGVNLAGVPSEDETGEGGGDTGDAGRVVDGWGLDWNRWWQAVQLGHGRPAAEAPGGATAGGQAAVEAQLREIFGVSATAAIYRRRALAAVSGGPAKPFDERLGSWYEDAELAVRLRRAGWRSLVVPAARVDHAGGATAAGRPHAYTALLYGNRWLVAASLLGRRFPLAMPRMLARDLADAARQPRRLPAIAAGWARAGRRLPRWVHAGPALETEVPAGMPARRV